MLGVILPRQCPVCMATTNLCLRHYDYRFRYYNDVAKVLEARMLKIMMILLVDILIS